MKYLIFALVVVITACSTSPVAHIDPADKLAATNKAIGDMLKEQLSDWHEGVMTLKDDTIHSFHSVDGKTCEADWSYLRVGIHGDLRGEMTPLDTPSVRTWPARNGYCYPDEARHHR